MQAAVGGISILLFLLLNVLRTGGEPAHNDVVVLEGHEADIPCVTSLSTGPGGREEVGSSPERPILILWYKDDVGSSIYSYDGRDPDNGRHWSPRRSLGGALNLKLPASPHARPQLAFLNIGFVHETDEGLYHCRVDFTIGPSRSTFTKLIVVAPPATPTVEVWAGGRWLHTTHETSTATVEIGTKLSLRCSTSGGKPSPTITWWRGGQQLLSQENFEGGSVSSSVNVTVVDEDAHTPIVCQASNTHLMPPLRTPLLLLVLSPPKWLRVLKGESEMSAGKTYTVECRVVGARPPPVITWSVGGDELHDASSVTDSEGETTSRLRFTPKAAHFGSHITCTARPPEHATLAASPDSTPSLWVKSDSVPLRILYKPDVQLKIQVMKPQVRGRQEKHRNNKRTREDVDSSNKPPPFSPSTSLRTTKSNQSTTNPATPYDAMNDVEGIDKRFPSKDVKDPDKRAPSKKAASGAGKGGHNVRGDSEGVVSVDEFQGVVLQCNVRANPPAYHVSWHRNGIPLSPVTTPGLLLGNMSAVLRHVKRSDAGNLTCTAHNKEGSTRSNPVQLLIYHDPQCTRDTVKILGVPRHHTLNVTCEVEAYPPPTSFSWALRSSSGILAVPSEHINFSGTISWISYTPRANVDFGDLLCWAHSANGRQEEPCVAQLVSAEKPDTPENCKVTKKEQDKLTVSCKAAHDGGLPQTFFMKVFHGGIQVTNSTSVVPEITAYDLQPDTRYRLTIWSANTHGTSTGHTNIYTSTLASNTSSTTSSMNGHSSKNPRGLLSKFGSSVLAVVVVVTVVGVVIGVVVGIMVRRVDRRPVRRSRRRHRREDVEEEEDDDGEERPPTLVNNNQVNVAMAGIGRRVPKCLEPLGKSTTRYNLMTNSGTKNDNHVYDDPISLRDECKHEENQTPPKQENAEVIHNLRYPPFSITSADFCHQAQNFSWHLPNSRLLRNKFSQRYPPHGGHPRKPVRVETPRLPEFDISTTVTTRRKFQTPTGMEFRLILIPETSKMLQVALDRDTRLASYLGHDSHRSNSPMKFPTITEEDELKHVEAVNDASVTPYESTPDDFTVENEQSDTSELLPAQDYQIETRAVIHRENHEQTKIRKKFGDYSHLREQHVSGNALHGLQITPQSIPTITIYGNGHARNPSGNQTAESKLTREDETQFALRNITNANTPRIQRNSLPEVSPNAHDNSKMKASLLGRQEGRENATPKRGTPSLPLVGKVGRHHPYGAPVSHVKRLIRSPTATPGKKKAEDINTKEPAHPTPNQIPNSPFAFLRKPKVGVTSLLSLVSSSSGSSSSSSCPSKRGGRESRDTTLSPPSENRRRVVSCSGGCGGVGRPKRSSFRNLRSRPRSMHYISGPERVLHGWEDGAGGEECLQSSSTPSSPRSSISSSSCFPYSSMSSSPVSSFYSSENSLSISATFSHTTPSSSSSFCFSSGSSSASSSSSSPFSSFLSPSLTSPSSSSVLSLSSCSPTPDSVLSGHITPT